MMPAYKRRFLIRAICDNAMPHHRFAASPLGTRFHPSILSALNGRRRVSSHLSPLINPLPFPPFTPRTNTTGTYLIIHYSPRVPNERGLIVSSLENGMKRKFGLATQGVEHACSIGKSLWKELKERSPPWQRNSLTELRL